MVTRNPLTDFAALPAGRILGLDFGTKRVGVAVSDSQRGVATGKGVLTGDFAQRVLALQQMIQETGAVGIVVGLPLNMDGSYGPMAQAAQAFAHEVFQRLQIAVGLWDERLSSRQAEQAFYEQRLDGRDGRRQTRASKKDSVGLMDSNAATVMLQSFLNGLPR